MLLEDEDEANMESDNQLLSNEEMNTDFRGEPSHSNSESGFQSENPQQSHKSQGSESYSDPSKYADRIFKKIIILSRFSRF